MDQSKTSIAVEEKKEVVVDRSAEFKEWFGISKIIEDDEYETLLGFFADNGKGVKKMELLFRGSDEGFEADAFHSKCDDQGPTLCLIQTEFSHICGGFTNMSWRDGSSKKRGEWREDPDAFIFVLRSPKDDVLPERWKVLPNKKEKTIKADAKWGPTFGYGYDIRISNNCHKEKDSVSQPDSSDASFATPKVEGILTGDDYFIVTEYEVYKVEM